MSDISSGYRGTIVQLCTHLRGALAERTHATSELCRILERAESMQCQSGEVNAVVRYNALSLIVSGHTSSHALPVPCSS